MTRSHILYDAPNDLTKYDKESENLMSDACEFRDAYNARFTLPEIVRSLRDSFKDSLTYYRVFCESRLRSDEDPATGFCMTSSYLIYDMTGREKIWQIYGTNSHWWLYHKKSHKIFDITHTQFKPRDLPGIYRLGQPVQNMQPNVMHDKILRENAIRLATYAHLR